MIYFTKYAEQKFLLLRKHGFGVTKAQVIKITTRPETVSKSRFSFYVSEGELNKSYNLRVILKKEDELEKIITFYPVKHGASYYE